MVASPDPAARVFGVLARAAPRVVLIRRGPSRHVLLITWDTVRHVFRAGQWFKGRIYEERCDLSPKGEHFIYLAANNKGPLQSWTAVSRPPFLTALTLWPNLGAWGGGGLFESERVIALNSALGVQPAEGFGVPPDVRVVPIARWAGRGEDDPIRSVRMKRDGWTPEDAGVAGEYQRDERYKWKYTRPECWRKSLGPLVLERRLLGVGELNGPWHAHEHRVLDREGHVVLDLGRSDWADWSRSDELLFTRGGQAYRVPCRRDGTPGEPEALIDLRGLRFEEAPPPREALDWKSKVVGRRIT